MTVHEQKEKKKPEKKQKKLDWKLFTANQYQQVAAEMVHFSAKYVNSNTLAFGIRLSSDMSLNLQNNYIAAACIDRKDIPLDYIKISPLVKQINAIRHRKLDRFDEAKIPQRDKDVISTCESILNMNYEPDISVGIRLRQIILQNPEGQDIAVTPLPCPGLSVLINARIKEEYGLENPKDGDDERFNKENFIFRKTGYFGIGGSNSQNVGLNVHDMQKPLMFKVPESSPEMKKIFSAYYNGISIKVNTEILRGFILWRKKLLAHSFDSMPSDMKIRKKETEFLIAITKDFMVRSARIENFLNKNREKLPNNKIFSPDLPFIQQALLDSSLRTQDWKRELADELHSDIIACRIWLDNQEASLGVGKQQTLGWISIIQGAL